MATTVPRNPEQSESIPLAAALKDATLAALVAFGLFFFLIGLHADSGPTGALVVTTRFETLAILVGVVFVGSFLRALLFGRGPIAFDRALPSRLEPARGAGRPFRRAGAARVRAAGAGAVL